ncbi:MAG: hypothetical protein Q4E37_03795 [Tissierellia bacterium]|nr:hypothetical protein [Tissierellia bacterium]
MRFKIRRICTFLLALVLFLGMVPLSGFAAGDLPEGGREENANRDVLWKLPEGTIFHAQGVGKKAHIANFGVSFVGSFIDKEGRTVLKVQTSQQNGTNKNRPLLNPKNPGLKHIVFKFDQALFDMIDFDKSYAFSDNEAAYDPEYNGEVKRDINRFTKPTFATTGTEMMIDYVGPKFESFRRDVYLTLKEGVTWENVKAEGPHRVETRIFNGTGTEVWSMHNNTKINPEHHRSYPTYTFSFVVTDLDDPLASYYTSGRLRRGGREHLFTKNARSFFQPEKGILKVLYFHTQNHLASDDNTLKKAFRQDFSEDLLPYLKFDDDGNFGRVYKADQFGYSTYNKTIDEIKAVPINKKNLVRQGGMYSFIAATQEFTELHDEKLNYGEPLVTDDSGGRFAILPQGPDGDPQDFFFDLVTGQSYLPDATVVEYNVDVDKMEQELFNNKDLAHTFNFTSMLLNSGEAARYFEYITDKDILVPEGATVDVNYGEEIDDIEESTDPSTWASNVYFGNQKALDLLWGISRGEYYTDEETGHRGTRYENLVGFTIPAGTPIRILNLDDKLSRPESEVDRVTFSITGHDGEVILQKTLDKKEPVGRKAEIIGVSLDTSSGYVQKSPSPLIHEIFTNSSKIRGLIETPNSWVLADYPLLDPPGATDEAKDDPRLIEKYDQRVYVYESSYSYNTITSYADDLWRPANERYKMPTKKVYTENVGIAETRYESGKAFEGYPMEFPEIREENLTKDMPISFKFRGVDKMSSDPVIEQVQAKVTFDLAGQFSKIDGSRFIEKIAPLNQEYAYTVSENKTFTKEKNQSYTPSGFATFDGKEIVGGDNLKIDMTRPTLSVKQVLKGQDGSVTTIDREVINFTDHNGNPYAINSDNGTVKADQIAQLLKRQFPVDEEVNLPNAKRLVGWTTQKLVDIEGGKTAEEQYYELLEKKDAEGQETNVIRNIEDWEKVDGQNPENFVFDAASPIDKHRTVYAVYGGPTIVLHSGVTDAHGNEIIRRLPITQADIDGIDEHITNLDANSQASVKSHTIIKELPQAPYTSRAEDIAKADSVLEDFKKEGHSFIGWRAYPEETGFEAGGNNKRIGALQNGVLHDANDKEIPVPKSTESYDHLLKEKTKATLPNGFNFSIKAEDFSYTDQGGYIIPYQTVEDIIKNVKEIHLYAVYRPFYEVTVRPQYQVVDKTVPNKPIYADGVGTDKQKPLQVGLLYRTAVTGYNVPTVDAAANYNPIGDGTVLKTWTPGDEANPTWTLPGFDILGQRRSYVSVVVPSGKELAYTKFASPFGETSWSSLGISTYVKSAGNSLDPNAPKNLYKDPDPNSNRDPYGVELAKTQAFEVANDTTIDAYTSATARKALLNEAGEVTGYDIVLTASPETLPTPEFARVKDTDTEIKLKWPGGTNYEAIDKVQLILDGTTYSLEKQADGAFAGENGLSASIAENQLVVTGINLEGKGGKDLTGQYLKTTASGDLKSALGNMRILSDKTSAPVEVFKQEEKQGDNPVVNFTVPDKVLDQVGTGSKYTVEKYDPENDTWIPVAQKIMEEGDKKGDKYGGNAYPIFLDPDTVAHGDRLRVVAEEVNPNADGGYSHPATSTVEVILDLEAPTGNITGTDETFRRFVNLEGLLGEVLDGQTLILELNTSGEGQGAEGNETYEFESKKAVISHLYTLVWQEDMPDMWVLAQDAFGNQGAIKVNYTHTLQLGTSMLDAKARKKYVNVTSDRAGAVVTITVYQDGNIPVAKGEAFVETAGDYVKLNFFANDDGVTAYRLKKGDRLHMTGKCEEGDTIYTANPVDKFIK